MTNQFKAAIEAGGFAVTVEVVPGRGALEPTQVKALEAAERIYATGRVQAVSITDNPGGNPALLADAFAADLLARNITPLVHLTCKDKNRNQLQSQLYALERQGINNLLIMTGDYPTSGYKGRPRPVFDLDPVQLLGLTAAMNRGLPYKTFKGEAQELPADFFAGAVTNPFKWTEAEVITQYIKLEKKLLSGARFIISQLGYDARKMQELVWFVRNNGYQTPLIANVFILTAGAGKFMKRGGIPGCYASDRLVQTLEQEAAAADKGLAAQHLRAAKMVAIARGLGYNGVHLGGHNITAQVVQQILDQANQLQNQWQTWAAELNYGAPGGFYLYKPEPETGLNASLPAALLSQKTDRKIMGGYGLSRFAHYWLLTPNKRGYKLLKKLMENRESKKGKNRRHKIEHLGKAAIYGCIDCGDCGLEATAYSCPMSQCPKSQRNGPCGGSSSGWCEVYPDQRYCIYTKAYHRLKKYNQLFKLEAFITPPNNWDFWETSSWSNYTHQRDNAAHREFLTKPKPESKPKLEPKLEP